MIFGKSKKPFEKVINDLNVDQVIESLIGKGYLKERYNEVTNRHDYELLPKFYEPITNDLSEEEKISLASMGVKNILLMIDAMWNTSTEVQKITLISQIMATGAQTHAYYDIATVLSALIIGKSENK